MFIPLLGLILATQIQTFEVVSVKPSSPIARGMSVQTSQGRFVARGATLGFLIQYAYRLKPAQISGGPDWLNTDRFDIEARADREANKDNDDALILMLRSALEDRFKLKSHHETKEQPIFLLTVAKSGSKLKPSTNLPQTQTLSGRGAASVASNLHTMSSRGATLANLAAQLSQILGRIVIDQTGLTGTFDIQLAWSDQAGATPPGAGDPALDGPSLFSALQEQLGLRLESSRGPVETLVIDSAEKPSDN